MDRPRTALVPVIVLLTACQAPAAQPDAAARIVDPTPESRAALARVVSEALNGTQALLADDALTTSSELVIERTRPRDLSGRSRRWVLTSTRCAPE